MQKKKKRKNNKKIHGKRCSIKSFRHPDTQKSDKKCMIQKKFDMIDHFRRIYSRMTFAFLRDKNFPKQNRANEKSPNKFT